MATPIINAQLDKLVYANTMIAGKLGALESPSTWATYQALVRAGVIGLHTQVGDQIDVEHSSMLTPAVSGEGVTAATVAKDTFLAAAGTEKHDYEFTFDGTNWHYEGATVTLADYGISVTGTAANGDVVTIHRTATTYGWNTLGINEDIPIDPNTPNCVTIQMDKVLSTLNFDPPMFLYAVSAAAWPNGLPAGTYTITLSHGAYNGGTTQDGTYAFTTTQVVPVGGGIRHSAIGAYQSSGTYTKAQITAGTFTTYGTDKLTAIESGLATTESDTGTSLGTTTACDPQYKSGDYVNFSQRQANGCNRLTCSYLFQLLNSDEASFTWVPKTIWSRPVSGTPEGFLHSIDPELRAVLTKVRKRIALPISDGYGYEDVEAFCFPATMMDVFGGQNNSIYEGPVDGSGNVKRTTAYTYWAQRNTNADRIKYQGTTARNWWLASCIPSSGSGARYVFTSGALSGSYANVAYGVVPSLYIG